MMRRIEVIIIKIEKQQRIMVIGRSTKKNKLVSELMNNFFFAKLLQKSSKALNSKFYLKKVLAMTKKIEKVLILKTSCFLFKSK